MMRWLERRKILDFFEHMYYHKKEHMFFDWVFNQSGYSQSALLLVGS